VSESSRSSNSLKPLPLEGIRVADFSWIVAGPQATRILADLGAEVIRIENESHLDSIRVGAQIDPANPSYNKGTFFNNLNRNKLGITANLNHPKGREVIEKLIAASDIVIENFSPGVFERMGFGWERLQQLNPKAIYVSISGFGHTGRDKSYVTWGPTAQAISGATAISGLPDQAPAGWGFSYLDHVAGYFAALAAIMALHHRNLTGEAQYVDIAQIETGMALLGTQMLDFEVNGRSYERIGNHSRYPAVAPHNTYRCADHANGNDQWIAIAAETEEQWSALCDALGGTALAADPRFATNDKRLENQDALDAALSALTRSHEPYELMYKLQARGIPAGMAQTTREKLDADPQLKARGFYTESTHPEIGKGWFEGLPIQFSRARWQMLKAAPRLGENTAEVLIRVLGMSEEEGADLMAEAAV